MIEYLYLFGTHNPFTAEQLARFPIIDKTREQDNNLIEITNRIAKYEYTEFDMVCVIDPGWEIIGQKPNRSVDYQRKMFRKAGLENSVNDDTVLVLQHLYLMRRMRSVLPRDQLHIHSYETYRKVNDRKDFLKPQQVVVDYCAVELRKTIDTKTLEQLDRDLSIKLGIIDEDATDIARP